MVIVAVAAVLRWRLVESFGPLPTFITFYPAVLLVASIGGGGPGIVATVLSALAADYWFLPPYGSFRVELANDVLALGIFTGSSLFLCVLAERLRRARWAEALSVAQEQQLEELSRLNEELSQQSEELSQQTEELSRQSEELVPAERGTANAVRGDSGAQHGTGTPRGHAAKAAGCRPAGHGASRR